MRKSRLVAFSYPWMEVSSWIFQRSQNYATSLSAVSGWVDNPAHTHGLLPRPQIAMNNLVNSEPKMTMFRFGYHLYAKGKVTYTGNQYKTIILFFSWCFPLVSSFFCMFTPCFLESNPETLSLHGRLPGEPHCRTSAKIVCSTPAIFMQETDNNFKNHILGCIMYTSFLDKFWKKMIWPSSIRILIWRTQILFKKTGWKPVLFRIYSG